MVTGGTPVLPLDGETENGGVAVGLAGSQDAVGEIRLVGGVGEGLRFKAEAGVFL